jgi:hypothetical protein
MIKQKTKSNMKIMISMMGLAVAAAFGVNTAMSEPINAADNNSLAGGIQVSDVSDNGGTFMGVSTDVGTALYQGFDYSAPVTAYPSRSIAPVNAGFSSGESTLTADQRAQCGFRRNERFKIITPVPEPTTLIAGGLLLLPFAASALRLRSRSRLAVIKRAS